MSVVRLPDESVAVPSVNEVPVTCPVDVTLNGSPRPTESG